MRRPQWTIIAIQITALLSASLIIVVILGIALQQSISNLAATIVSMLFQPFRIDELIEGNGVLGVVKEIQLFSTVLVTAGLCQVAGRQQREHRSLAVGKPCRLLGPAVGPRRAGQGPLRCRGHYDTIPAAGCTYPRCQPGQAG